MHLFNRTWPVLIALVAVITAPWFQTPVWAAGNDASMCGSGQARGAFAIKQRAAAFAEILELLGYADTTAEHCDLCEKMSGSAALPPALLAELEMSATHHFSIGVARRGHAVGSPAHRARAPPEV